MWTKLTEYAEGIAEIVAPPDSPADGAGQYEGPDGGSAGSSAAGLATADVIDEDEQEQYISELERALLQRKKANDALEQRIRELEESQAREQQRFKLQLQQQESVIASQNAQLLTQKREHEGAMTALRMTMLQPKSQNGSSADTTAEDSSSSEQSPHFASLVQVMSILSSLIPSDRPQVPETDEAAVVQILTLSQEAVQTMNSMRKRLSVLQSSMASFLTLHDKEFDASELSTKRFSQSFSSSLQAKLAGISESLLTASSISKELERVQQKLKAMEAKDEEQAKKAMHLQAQVNSMQAIQKNTERTLQHTASSKEAELLAVIDEKQTLITRLQASTSQMKGSMEHLAVELESAQAEIDDLESIRRSQLKELETLRQEIQEADNRQASFETLQHDEREIRARAGEYEQGYMQLLDEMEKLKTQYEEDKANLAANAEAHAFSADNQTIYELESRFAASEADRKVAVQDAERFQRDLETLEGVMHQFQTESKHQQARLAELEAALEQSRKLQQQSQEKNANAVPEEDMQRVMTVLNKKTQECEQLREALEHSATRYSSESDVLDKSLAAQLVVSFCESDKKGEILQLISSMMGFSEEQKRRVGLGLSPPDGHGGGGLFSSVLGFVAPVVTPPEGAQQIDVDGKSFSDIWTEFLLKEAKR